MSSDWSGLVNGGISVGQFIANNGMVFVSAANTGYTVVRSALDGRTEWGTFTLFGRVKVDWREMIMGVGTVLCVAAFVFFFFTGRPILSFVSLFMAGVTMFGGYYVKKFPTLLSLNETAASLKVTNKTLDDSLALHKRDLSATRQQLEAETRQLRGENEALRQTREHLQQAESQLQGRLRELAERNWLLGEQVGRMTEAGKQIEREVIDFGRENLQLRNSVDGLAKRNESFHERFDTDLTVLGGHIAQTKELHRETFDHISRQKADLARDKEALTKQKDVLTKQQEEMAAQQAALAKQFEELKRFLADLQNKDFFPEKQKIVDQMHKQIRDLSDQTAALEATRARLEEQNRHAAANLARVQKEFEDTRRRLQSEVDRLGNTRRTIDLSVDRLVDTVDTVTTPRGGTPSPFASPTKGRTGPNPGPGGIRKPNLMSVGGGGGVPPGAVPEVPVF